MSRRFEFKDGLLKVQLGPLLLAKVSNQLQLLLKEPTKDLDTILEIQQKDYLRITSTLIVIETMNVMKNNFKKK